MARLKVPCSLHAPGPNSSPDREGGGHRRSSQKQPIKRFMARGAMHLAILCLPHRCVSTPLALAAPLRFRPEGPALSAWHEMPGQASPRRVALQGQFSAGPCRVMAGPRGELRGGALAGLMVPSRAFVAAAHGPVSTANPNPDASITCNWTARCRGGVKRWPYRPKRRTCRFPGIASRAG